MTAQEEGVARRYPLTALILVALVAGGVVGSYASVRFTAPLGEIGLLVITAIKTAATPLIFLAILDGVLRNGIRGRDGVRMLVVCAINASLALAIGLAISNLLQPGLHLSPEALGDVPRDPVAPQPPLGAVATITGFVPKSVLQPFIDNVVLTLVVMAVMIGFALRRVRGEGRIAGVESIADMVAAARRATEIVLGWIIMLVPLAVFAVVAKSVGHYGFKPLTGLALYVAAGLIGMALHIVVVYHAWIVGVARMGFAYFWREARCPVVYALGANSSLATLPLTLRTLDRLKVSPSSANLGACVGTNFNNDGIMLYEAMAALLVAQASGMHLGLGQQLAIAGFSAVAALGIAGVPEAGMAALTVVLGTVGMPMELLPLLLSVDWILARARSATNVLGDLVVSIAVDRLGARTAWRGGATPAAAAPAQG